LKKTKIKNDLYEKKVGVTRLKKLLGKLQDLIQKVGEPRSRGIQKSLWNRPEKSWYMKRLRRWKVSWEDKKSL